MALTRDDILKANDHKTVVVDVPEWGGEVIVSTMTGFTRDQFEASCVGKNGGTNMKNIRARLCAATIVDEQGNIQFSEDDITKLGNKSGAALGRVFDAASKLNNITQNDVETLAKN